MDNSTVNYIGRIYSVNCCTNSSFMLYNIGRMSLARNILNENHDKNYSLSRNRIKSRQSQTALTAGYCFYIKCPLYFICQPHYSHDYAHTEYNCSIVLWYWERKLHKQYQSFEEFSLSILYSVFLIFWIM